MSRLDAGIIAAWLAAAWIAPCCAGDGSSQDAKARATEVAQAVESHAERTEAKEGRSDLVEDRVEVVTGKDGKPIIEQTGEASYYGAGFQGKSTASGERFDANGLSAAHPTLPLGTPAKVTNLATGRSVAVDITDRGPYAYGRDIDLSRKAAEKIGLDKKTGTAPVRIEVKLPSTGK